MRDLERQIEDAADLFCEGRNSLVPLDELDNLYCHTGFTTGAKSPEAKEYWQQGMYSEEEVKKISLYAAEHAQDNHMQYPYEWFNEWFENNKKKL